MVIKLPKEAIDVIVFLFGTLLPVLWAGHKFICEKIANELGHKEITEGLTNISWILTTVGIWYVFNKFVAFASSVIKILAFLAALIALSLAFYGIVTFLH